MDKAKYIADILKSIPDKKRNWLLGYAIFIAAQIVWYAVAFFIVGEGEGFSNFLRSWVFVSVTHILVFFVLTIVNLALFVLLIRCSHHKPDSANVCDNKSLICKEYQKWNMRHGDNTYTITYEQLDQAIYTKEVEVIPITDDLKEFIDGTYNWTGDIGDEGVKPNEPYPGIEGYEHEIKDKNRNLYHFRRIDVNRGLEPNKPIRYTVDVLLKNSSRKAKPFNTFSVRRPINSIIFVVKIHNDIFREVKDKPVAIEKELSNLKSRGKEWKTSEVEIWEISNLSVLPHGSLSHLFP